MRGFIIIWENIETITFILSFGISKCSAVKGRVLVGLVTRRTPRKEDGWGKGLLSNVLPGIYFYFFVFLVHFLLNTKTK